MIIALIAMHLPINFACLNMLSFHRQGVYEAKYLSYFMIDTQVEPTHLT